MIKQPWMKFYPSDWRADPAVKSCGLAARGLWIEMLAIMHEADPRGSLVVNKKPVSTGQLASLVGASENLVFELLSELRQAGVFSTRRNGVIFSRRIERDEIKSSRLRDNGRKGGNPTLCKDSENASLLNQGDKPQKPEARSHIDSLGASAPSEPAPPDLFEEFWKAYPRREGPNPKKPARTRFNQLVKAGHDPAAIIAAARQLAKEHPKPTRFVPQAVTWLNQERHADAIGDPSRLVAADQWQRRLEHARKNRKWPVGQWGPRPHEPGCLAPPDLVQADDGNGWIEQREAA